MTLGYHCFPVLLVSGLLLTGAYGTRDITCKDESGNPVDWFIAYKLPKDPNSADQGYHSGAAYSLILPQNQTWTRSSRLIHQNDSILAITLGDLYPVTKHLVYVLYNDQPPNLKPDIKDGHTKGVIIVNENGGLLLQHSVPHFPAMNDTTGYSYPLGGLQNGQMFFCLSLDVGEVDSIGGALEYTKPFIYEWQWVFRYAEILPKLNLVLNKKETRKSSPWFTTFQLHSGSLNSRVFVKGPKFHTEIYGNWIREELSIGLDVQSWLNGAHPIHSQCTNGTNQTIGTIQNILSKSIEGTKFSTVNDHSKWAVSTIPQKPWICIGDLNRTKAQKRRGGLTICFSNPNIWRVFQNTIVELEPCNSRSVFMSKRHRNHQ